MTALEQITDFVKSYPGADILQDFQIDYTDQIPNNGGAFPSGLATYMVQLSVQFVKYFPIKDPWFGTLHWAGETQR